MITKWLSSFYSKLVIALLASFLMVIAVMMYLMSNLTDHYQNEVEQKLHKQLAAHMVKDHQLLKDGTLDHSALKAAFHSMMVLGPAFEFYVLDTDGRIQTYSAEPGKVKRTHVSLDSIQKFLSGSANLPILGDDPRSVDRSKIFSVSEIRHQNQLVGYLYIIIGGEKYDDLAAVLKDSQILKLGIWGFLAVLIFILLTLMVVFGLLTRPLRKLSEDVQLFRHSGFRLGGDNLQRAMYNWNERGDEIHRLGAAFRAMAIEMQSQYEKVKTTDELRKELISYVSHDLRTPLSALLGYLETWQLSKDRLSDTEKEALVRIALENAQHINNLVDQLFELARLDSEHVSIDREAVSLTDLCFDVAQSLSVLAKAKQVSIRVVHPENDALIVEADLPKMERAIINLLDNAIRHCREQDAITIELARVEEQKGNLPERDTLGKNVRVSVTDTGVGIPEKDLPHIFDAYFRAGNSAKSKKGNSGLGLAITRKIIQLHGSDIDVESREGEGARFSFLI